LSRVRRRLEMIFSSAEVCTIFIASYVPINWFRIAVLRAWGGAVGSDVAIHHGFQVRSARRLRLGSHIFIAEGVTLDARGGLTIGDNVSLNSDVQIWTAQHDWRSHDFAYVASPSSIGSRCWVSTRVTILPGVDVGEGAVMAAGSVVTSNVEAFCLVGGIPAKKIADRPHDIDYTIEACKFKVWWW